MDQSNPHASPTQTVVGKGSSNPLMAEDLPKILQLRVIDASALLVGLVTRLSNKIKIRSTNADESALTVGPTAPTFRTAMLQYLKSLNCVYSSKRMSINCVNV